MSPQRAHGFTLIEVLVALVIVALGMAAVMSALTSSANTVIFLKDETFANWVGLNKIATLRLSGQVPATGTSDGDTDFASRSWHWRQEVVSTDVPGIVRIEVKVRPKEVKAGDDAGWTTSVLGIVGNSVGLPDGYNPNWGQQQPRYGVNPNGQATNGVGSLGANGQTGATMQVAPPSSGTGLGSLGSDSGLGGSSTSGFGSDLDNNTNNNQTLESPPQQPPQPP